MIKTNYNARFIQLATEVNTSMPDYVVGKIADILNETGVALLPGSDFGLNSNRMLARLSYTDFEGSRFLQHTLGGKKLDNADLKKICTKYS